jgi:hypothetical protein
VPSPPQDVVRDEWQAEELLHNSGNEVAGAIWRVTGDGGTAILKIATPRRAGPPRTWPRATTQGTGTTGGAKPSRTAVCWPPPRTRASPVRTCSMCRSADGSVALWLQDVPGAPGTSAGVDALADVAYRLGAGHARWLERPAEPWLARDWLCDYTLAQGPGGDLDWDVPIAAGAWPDRLRRDLRTTWERRHDLLAAADRLPRTLCHHDVWPMNLVLPGSAAPVLLDWAFTGPGAKGEEAANLALDAFWDGLADLGLLDEVIAAVSDGYRRGPGGAVDDDTVRRAVMVTGAAKYFWIAPRLLAAAATAPAAVPATTHGTWPGCSRDAPRSWPWWPAGRKARHGAPPTPAGR